MKALNLVVAGILGASPVGAQVPEIGAGVPVSPLSWTKVPEGNRGSDSPSQHDREEFGESLMDGVFDQICRQISLQGGTSLNAGDFATVNVKVKRRIRRYADGRLALVDETPLSLALGWSPDLWNIGERGTVGVRVGGRLEGTSLVVRPLKNAKSCKELDRLLNVLDYKTILPLSAKRIGEIEVGELWKVPVRFELGGGPAVGGAFTNGSVVFHAGKYRSRDAMLTLYRKSEGELRLRVRLDRATALRGGVEATASIETAELGLDIAENVFADVLDSEISRELRKVLQARLSWSETISDKGTATLLEFVLDPRDAGQMARVAKVAMGDLNVLTLWAKKSRKSPSRGAAPEELAAELAASHAENLEAAPSYAGTDQFRRSGRSFELKVPALLAVAAGSGLSVDRIGSAGEDSVVHAASADRSSSRRAAYVPWLGYLTRHDLSRSAQLYFDESLDGPAGRPAAVYVQQEGFAEEAGRTPRLMTERADSVMRLVGAFRDRPRQRLADVALPMSELFPEGAKTPVGYDGGVTAFTLILGRDAVDAMLFARPDEVARAYVHTLEGSRRALAEKVLYPRLVGRDGKIVWDSKAAALSAPRDAKGALVAAHLQEVGSLRAAVEELNEQLARARSGSRMEQADVFRRLLSKEASLKVLVQFAHPKDVSGEFVIRVDKGGEEKDLRAHYRFNPGLPDAAEVSALKEKRDRLKKPSTLTD